MIRQFEFKKMRNNLGTSGGKKGSRVETWDLFFTRQTGSWDHEHAAVLRRHGHQRDPDGQHLRPAREEGVVVPGLRTRGHWRLEGDGVSTFRATNRRIALHAIFHKFALGFNDFRAQFFEVGVLN